MRKLFMLHTRATAIVDIYSTVAIDVPVNLNEVDAQQYAEDAQTEGKSEAVDALPTEIELREPIMQHDFDLDAL